MKAKLVCENLNINEGLESHAREVLRKIKNLNNEYVFDLYNSGISYNNSKPKLRISGILRTDIEDINNYIKNLIKLINKEIFINKNYKIEDNEDDPQNKVDIIFSFDGVNESFINEAKKNPTSNVEKKKKFNKVMGEFGKGKLKTSAGKVVKDKKQALAIAYSESGQSKKVNEMTDENYMSHLKEMVKFNLDELFIDDKLIEDIALFIETNKIISEQRTILFHIIKRAYDSGF